MRRFALLAALVCGVLAPTSPALADLVFVEFRGTLTATFQQDGVHFPGLDASAPAGSPVAFVFEVETDPLLNPDQISSAFTDAFDWLAGEIHLNGRADTLASSAFYPIFQMTCGIQGGPQLLEYNAESHSGAAILLQGLGPDSCSGDSVLFVSQEELTAFLPMIVLTESIDLTLTASLDEVIVRGYQAVPSLPPALLAGLTALLLAFGLVGIAAGRRSRAA